MVIKITIAKASHYRVFACWYGGYTGSDSWKMNSGITAATQDENGYHFTGSSGSVYHCHKDGYGISGYGASVLAGVSKSDKMSIEHLPEETNFLELNYED